MKYLIDRLKDILATAAQAVLSRLKPVIFGTAAVALVLVSGTAVVKIFAPHLPRLVVEGYPSPQWPAAGKFAPVAGNPPAGVFEPTGELNEWLQQMVADSQGKALLIYQGDRLRIAHYDNDIKPETRFNSYSLAKSLVGALLLKAQADGKIESLDDPIGRYLPEIGDDDFRNIPLHAFARMQSGLATEYSGAKSPTPADQKALESFRSNPFGPMARLHIGGLEAIAGELTSLPEARGQYSYQNTNTALIGAVLAKVYDQSLPQLLAEKIWRPSGAAPADWRQHGANLPVSSYCCIYATASDWLRVGTFLMQNGSEEDRFLPEPLWRELFATALVPADRASGSYGIHIYHDVLDRAGEPLQGSFSYMLGRGGQVVYMMPEKQLVVVRFGEGNQLLHSTLYAAWSGLKH